MASNKIKVQPDPQFMSDAQRANAEWTASTGSVADGAETPTGPRKKSNAGPVKTNARRQTTKKRSGS